MNARIFTAHASLWLLLQVFCHPAVAQQPAGDSLCRHDRERLLALDEDAFDQNPAGGWRAIARVANCYGVAADLIRDYRALHPEASTTVAWHEGQLRANLGETVPAINLFNQARHDNDISGWNHYVDASIAFLMRDRDALLQARSALAGVPRPDIRWTDASGETVDIAWPPNLEVVDRLLRCWDYPYETAYGRCPVVLPGEPR